MAGLVQNAQLLPGPIAEDGLAVDKAAHYRANFSAVIRHGAMIAQHKVSILRNHSFRIGARILVVGWNIGLGQHHTVHVNAPVGDADAVTRQADHALDEALARIARIVKDDDVTALDALKVIDQLVDEDALLVFKARLHAAAFNLDRLI